MALRTLSLDDLTIDDERSVAGVALFGRLKQALRRSSHRFHVPELGARASWDRVLFLNLTYWTNDVEADVLCDEHIPADVVAHVAWHGVVSRQLAELSRKADAAAAPPTAEALFFAESIASAFDLYLVGRLLPIAPDSDFVTTQVPLLSECAQEAGMSEAAFAALLEEVSRDPERAFEDLRALLFDVALALVTCQSATAAQTTLERFVGHRFEPLLHHFQLSNWILYARAYAARTAGPDAVVREMDAALRTAPTSLVWLDERWIDGDLLRSPAQDVSRNSPAGR
jgi:hypothetical protein